MLGSRLRQGSCRLCLWESNSLWDIFGELAERRNFVRKIQACVNIIVSKDDGLSPLVCPNCIYKVELFYDFQTSCRRSDEIQKLYNGVQDDEGAACAAADDVLPGTALHCALSNSHKDAQCPVETIDIKEEPLEYDEALDGRDDERFEDAEVELEEVVAVTEDRLTEHISATETDQQKEKSKKEEGADGAEGSCLQLTPPRSPSLTSELTYSASEAGGLAEAGALVEQQQQNRQDQQKVVEPRQPPPAKYYNQCRFCRKWFQKTGVCRAHEMACAPLHGYAPPPPPTTQFASKSCRCCSALFVSSLRRARHEYHCFRHEREVQSLELALGDKGSRREVPLPAKYSQQCRFCRKYLRTVLQRRLHEVECGSRLGYSPEQLKLAVNTPSVERTPVRRCTLCGKMLKSLSSRFRHERYCRRTSAQKRGLVSTPMPVTPSPADDRCHFQSLPQCGSGELSCPEEPACPVAPEVQSLAMLGDAGPQREVPPPAKLVQQCRFCHKYFYKVSQRRHHEVECGSRLGYSPEQLKLAVNAPTVGRTPTRRCNFCGKMMKSASSRFRHEVYCRRSSAQKCSLITAPTPVSPSHADDRCHFQSLPQSASPELSCPEESVCPVAPEVQSLGLLGDAGPLRDVPPPAKFLQQCRFCRKYFRKVSQRRHHEIQCGSQLGYSREQLKLSVKAPSVGCTPARMCILCGKIMKSVLSRFRHERYCRRTSAQKCSLVSTPTPVTPSPTDDHCRFQSLPQCATRHLSCPEEPACPVAPEPNAASLSGGQDVIKCRLCGKGHLKWRSLMTHEYHCRRKAPPHSEADSEGTARTVEEEGGPEVTGSDGGRDEGGESSSLVHSTVSKDDTQVPANRCRHCRQWFRSKKTCKLHEYYCPHNVHLTVGDSYTCSFCPQKFTRLKNCILHERQCRQQLDRTGDSATVSRAAEHVISPEQQSAPTRSETALSGIRSIDQQEVISPAMPEQEEKIKKVDTPLYTPVTDSIKETDFWMCQYCDRVFKYRESFRSHVVKCSAIATYQYSMPHHRPPTFFKCPLCQKAFKLRRRLHNHWKVCKARTSVIAEAAESNGVTDPTRTRSEEPDGSGTGVTALFGNTSSPGEDREEWHGWPSSHSQTMADLLTDEDSNAVAIDSCGLSCKLCNRDFCSRVLLELHTLNECVYQRIRNDHAYAQCESPGIDESTLMRMARVKLQRLLLCSCCGDIFTDRRALAEHELSERQRNSRGPTGVEDPSQYDPDATHLQKRLKLGREVDELVLKLEGGGQQESICRAGQLTIDTATITKLENADSRQYSNKSSILREILCGSDTEQFLRKVESEKQIKGDVDIQQQERQQLESTNGEKQSSNNSVLQECIKNNCNQEKLNCDSGKKVYLVDTVLKQGSRMEVFRPQYQEFPCSDHQRQLQNKVPNLNHLLQQQQLEDRDNKQNGQSFSEENCGEETTRENQCPKINPSQDAVHSQESKKGNPPQDLCNGRLS